MNNPATKAAFWSLVFLLIGVVGWFLNVSDATASLPLGIFYLILVINTYYSIKLFSAITPKENKLNAILDILLGIMYILMALHLHKPLHFAFFDLLLFIVATAKYTFLINTINHLPLLKKKILVDLSGCMLCALTIGGMLWGNVLISSWLLAGLFALANILLFFIWPLYRLDSEI